MPMVTTCPHCATSFNVAPEVLLSRNGRVRCGSCKQIFDGLLHLTTLDALQSASAAGARAAPATVQSVAAAEPHWPALPNAPEVPIPPMPIEVAAAASAKVLPDSLGKGNAPPTPAQAPGPSRWSSYRAGDDADAGDGSDAAPEPSRKGWALAAVLVALLLAGQVLYRYRSELAAYLPAIKPALAQLCAWAGCSVPPLQQPAALNIEASDLQIVDKAQPQLVQLTATLRNRSTIDVGYPALDLVLTDSREHALLRRVIVPADYLSDGARATIAANAETTVRIDMDIGSLPAAGFRLNLTHAPAY